MHSILHDQLVRTAAQHADREHRAAYLARRHHPPPIRGRVAYVAARLARRLDVESARKAIA